MAAQSGILGASANRQSATVSSEDHAAADYRLGIWSQRFSGSRRSCVAETGTIRNSLHHGTSINGNPNERDVADAARRPLQTEIPSGNQTDAGLRTGGEQECLPSDSRERSIRL